MKNNRCEICDRPLVNVDSRVGDSDLCWRVWYEQSGGDGGRSAESCLAHAVNWRLRAKASEAVTLQIIQMFSKDRNAISAILECLKELIVNANKEEVVVMTSLLEEIKKPCNS